ncbi:MAG: hypothetical protein ACOZHQ_08090 [Thermodesulfobacteriota bacterium]
MIPQKPQSEMTPQELLGQMKLVVMEFEGVISDGRAWIDDQGRLSAATYRPDELGLTAYLKAGGRVVVIARRDFAPARLWAERMGVTFREHDGQKNACLQAIVFENAMTPRHLCYVGRDLDDLTAMSIASLAVAVADADPWAKGASQLVLGRPGGAGAVRELCDLLLKNCAPAAEPGK